MLQLLFLLLLPVHSLSHAASTSTACNRSCGSRDHAVPYPFGFSAGCPIHLSCTDPTTVLLNGNRVLNFTSNGTMCVEVPPTCNRTLTDAMGALIGGNYALSARTGLFLRGCKLSSNCSIPTSIVSAIMHSPGVANCSGINDSTACVSKLSTDPQGFLPPEVAKSSNCSNLLTSVAFLAEQDQAALVFGVAELGWWLNGTCSGGGRRQCAANATCGDVTTPDRETGFRCVCEVGFDGDGYLDGDGCIKAKYCPNKKSGSCDDHANVLLIVGGTVAGIAAAVGLVLFCRVLHRRYTARSGRLAAMRLLSEASSRAVPVYSYHEVARATNSFSHTHRLGTGAYGTVYIGKLPATSPSLVAIKRLRRRHDDDDNTAAIALLMNEIKLISSLDHPNLVRLLGCCLDRGEQILVYEFMPNGTLSQHLLRRGDHRHRGLPWRTRLDIALETANAIVYLHGMHPPIFHRDVKSSNILLDREFRPKLADFGLSRAAVRAEASHISTAPQGTPGYVDPEYHQNFHLSDKSDVYSFGVVLLELITAMKVVDFSRTPTEVNLASLALDRIGKGKVDEIVDPVLVDQGEEWVMESIRNVSELAFRCLAFQKDVRPCMSEVADELRRIRDGAPELGPGSGPMGLDVEVGFDGPDTVETKRVDDSPVSVQEVWVSDQSSPSTNGSMPRFVA